MKIYLNEMVFYGHHGVHPEERKLGQRFIVNFCYETNSENDKNIRHIEDTIDYEMVRDQVIEMGRCSEFFLIECLAERVAGICLGHEGVGRVEVTVEKPNALQQTTGVAVQISRP